MTDSVSRRPPPKTPPHWQKCPLHWRAGWEPLCTTDSIMEPLCRGSRGGRRSWQRGEGSAGSSTLMGALSSSVRLGEVAGGSQNYSILEDLLVSGDTGGQKSQHPQNFSILKGRGMPEGLQARGSSKSYSQGGPKVEADPKS